MDTCMRSRDDYTRLGLSFVRSRFHNKVVTSGKAEKGSLAANKQHAYPFENISRYPTLGVYILHRTLRLLYVGRYPSPVADVSDFESPASISNMGFDYALVYVAAETTECNAQ